MKKILIVTIVLTLFLFVTPIGFSSIRSSYNVTDYWSFDENTGPIAYDTGYNSSKANNITNIPAWNSSCILNACANSSTSGTPRTILNLEINGSMSRTWSWWGYYGTSNINTYVLSTGSATNRNMWSIGRDSTNNKISFHGFNADINPVSNTVYNNKWNYYTVVYNESTGSFGLVSFYINGTLNATLTPASKLQTTADVLDLFTYVDGTTRTDNFLIDELFIVNGSMSASHISQSYLCYLNGNNPLTTDSCSGTNVTITASDVVGSSEISEFNATIRRSIGFHMNGSLIYESYNATTTNGTAIFPIQKNTTYLWDVLLYSQGKYDVTYLSVNLSSNYNGLMYRAKITNVAYSGNISNATSNWVRSLSYVVYVDNCTGTNVLERRINNTLNLSTSFDCGSGISNTTILSTYNPSHEGYFNLSFKITNNTYANYSYQNTSFIADLYAPAYIFNYTLSSGFVSNATVNSSLNCTDTIYTPLLYNLTYRGSVIVLSNRTANTTVTNTSSLGYGEQTFTYACSDLFSTNSSSSTFFAYIGNFILWDELFNTPFNLSFTNGARLWQDDNSSYYDFKTNNRNNISIVVTNLTKFRVEQNFSSGETISRYIDLAVTNDSLIKVCTNRDGTAHYQQIVYSSLIKYVSIKNSYNGCYVLSDYTRFAYQEAYAVVGYTIASNYYMHALVNGATTLLASIDGVIQANLNIDNLEYTAQGFDIDLRDDSLVVTTSTLTNTTTIYYQNLEEDNEDVTLAIYRVDDGSLVLNVTNITTPNLWNVQFYYGGYANTNSSTLFKAIATITKSDNSVQTLQIIFNGEGTSGGINKAVGIIMVVAFIIGGLTLFSQGAILSFLGFVVSCVALVINIMTETNIVSQMLYAIIGIIMMYQLIMMFGTERGLNIQ